MAHYENGSDAGSHERARRGDRPRRQPRQAAHPVAARAAVAEPRPEADQQAACDQQRKGRSDRDFGTAQSEADEQRACWKPEDEPARLDPWRAAVGDSQRGGGHAAYAGNPAGEQQQQPGRASDQQAAGNGGQDLAEINTLNHYIGMKPIVEADFLEMKVLPFAIGVFSLLTLRAVVVGRIMSVVDLVVLFCYFGAFSMASFAYRLYSYGHHLDPRAPMTIEPFMPVVVGSQQIANFVQTSLPLAGTACMALFFVLLLAALWTSVRQVRQEAV